MHPIQAPSPILSRTEFLTAVHEINPRTAVFDCDGTLWAPDAGAGFMTFTVESGLLSAAAAEWIADRHRMYHRGEIDEFTICGEMVQVYKGLHESMIREAARTFFQTRILPFVFPEMQQLVADLQSAGTEVWAVSSTYNCVIEESLHAFNIPANHILAAAVAVHDGVVTDELLMVPTDEGKAEALRSVGITLPDAVFGNSIHDAAMLQMARRAFPINPTEGLQQICKDTRCPVYYPEVVPYK